METCTETIRNDTKNEAAAEIGSIATYEEVTLVPIPYVGSEQPIVYRRPVIDEFMTNKPA